MQFILTLPLHACIPPHATFGLSSGHRLWLCQKSKRKDLDIVWNSWVPRSRDHPQQGQSFIPQQSPHAHYDILNLWRDLAGVTGYSFLFFCFRCLQGVCILILILIPPGLQQSCGLVGTWSPYLWNGCWLPSLFCWPAYPDLRKDCVWQGMGKVFVKIFYWSVISPLVFQPCASTWLCFSSVLAPLSLFN